MSLNQILALPTETKEKLFEALRQLYADLDKELKNHPQPCTGCGGCCHFSKAEHRLYGSSLELALMMETHPNPQIHDEDRCPHQVGLACQVREERLIGCRTFFRLHTKSQSMAAEELHETFLSRLKDLHRQWDLDWEYRDLMSLYS